MALGRKTGGRQKGTPNRTTQAAKDAIAEVAAGLGGAARMLEWAQEDPKNEGVFWERIYPKLMPVQLTGEDGGAIQSAVTLNVVGIPKG